MRPGVFGLLVFWLPVAGVFADTIHFKDGMRTVCQTKAWEEDQQVKCEYDGGVISYSSQDVLRIDKSIEEPSEVDSETSAQAETEAPAASLDSAAATAPSVGSGVEFIPASGIAFYDPRRPKKYWSSPEARHATYGEAVEALRREFGLTTDRVERIIGTSNDLLEIRRRLAAGEVVEDKDPSMPQHGGEADTIEFYNPRRANKYWSSNTSKHQSYQDAIEALAEEFGQTSEWVETHMGATNDLMEIRRNLEETLDAPPVDPKE
jgi:hypothetical protein